MTPVIPAIPTHNFYSFTAWDYAAVGVFVLVYMALAFGNRLPSIDTFQKFVSVLNSRGGNILILAVFSLYFFRGAMHLVYHLLAMQQDVITKQDSIVMTAMGFVTGTAFGGAWGAMLKSMTGSESQTRAADGGNNGKTITPPPPTIPTPAAQPKAGALG